MKEHKISLTTAVLLNMNIMIGSGVLIGPALIAAQAGNASFLAWPIAALIFLPMVLCTAQLGNMFPTGGGFYVYAREGLNTTAGYISGFMYMIGYTLTVAVEVMALRRVLLGVMAPNWFLTNPPLFNIVAILVFMGLNLMSFKFFSRMLNSLTLAKILPLVIVIVLLPFVLNWNFTVSTAELSALPSGLTFAIFGFFGFEYCGNLAHLIEDSERNAPRAAIYGFLATTFLYTLFHFGVLNIMGAEQLTALGAPAFSQFLPVAFSFLKPMLVILIPLASVLTIFAAGNGVLNGNLVMMESMAQQRLFYKSPWIAKLNRNGRPWFAAVIQGIVILTIVTLLPDINHVGGLCNLSILAAFMLPFISLLILQHRIGLKSRMPLTVLALVATVALGTVSFWQLGSTMVNRCLYASPILILLALGYAIFVLRDTPTEQSRPLNH